jgi:hypothetical protein
MSMEKWKEKAGENVKELIDISAFVVLIFNLT